MKTKSHQKTTVLLQPEHTHKQSIIWRLIKLAWTYRVGCIKSIILEIVLLIIGLSGLKFAGLGIDYIRKLFDRTAKDPHWPFNLAPPPDWTPFQVLLYIALAGLAFALGQYVLNYLSRMTKAKFLQGELVVDLRSAVYEKLQRLSFRFYDSRTSGALINRVTSDVQSVRLFVDGVILQSISIVIALTVYLFYMFSTNFRLTLICLGTFPLIFFISYSFSVHLKPAYLKSKELMDNFILNVVEFLNGIHVIKGFAREKYELNKLGRHNAEIRDQKQKIFFLVALLHPLISFLNELNVAIVLGYGGYLVMKGEFPLGSGLVVFVGLIHRLSGQINASVQILDNIQHSLAAATRVFEILDAPIQITPPQNPIVIPRTKGTISFRHVYFEYQPGERVLEDIHFDVPAGTFVGILGPIGCGKSTLLSLIPRFYDPSMGSIHIDGYDIRQFEIENLRRQIGIVFQESFLFSTTIAANIAFGKPDATQKEIEWAAHLAAADEFILKLPQQYETVIGESGADLSGGQRQRLALARALLYDPPILLLDDPTAAVDAHTEKEIMEGIERAMKGRTTFLVSNRISVLKNADIIYVLHKGKIVQSGSHQELLQQEGYYKQTAEIQEIGVVLVPEISKPSS